MSDEWTIQVGGGPMDLDDGTYAATLVAMEPFTYEHAEGPRQLMRWTFSLDDYETAETNVPVEGVSSIASGPKSKMYGWLTALLGPEKMLERPKLNRHDLLGRECVVEIRSNAQGYPKVHAVLPRPKRKARPVAPVADPQ